MEEKFSSVIFFQGIEKSYLVKLFDPVISPRCYGIVAVRDDYHTHNLPSPLNWFDKNGTKKSVEPFFLLVRKYYPYIDVVFTMIMCL